MSIKEKIKEHMESETVTKRMTAYITGESGSFELPKGFRLVLKDCQDWTCEGSEGRNELNVIGGSGGTITGLKDCILRLEDTGDMQEITVNENVRINASGIKIQKLDITKSQVLLIDCELEEATFTTCDVITKKNQYQKCTMTGGAIFSDDDKFQDETSFEESAVGTINKGQFEGKLTLDKASIKTKKCEFKDKVEITDAKLTDSEGKFSEQITLSEISAHATFRKSEFEEKLNFSDGTVFMNDCKCTEKLDGDSIKLNAKKLECEEEVTIQNSDVIMVDCKLSKESTFEKCASRLFKNEFEDKVTFEKGAVDSEKNKYSDDVTLTGCSIESVQDEFKKIDGTDLIAVNRFITTKQAEEIDLKSEDASSILEILKMTCTDFTVEKFGIVRGLSIEGEKLKATDVGSLLLVDCKFSEGTCETCGTVQLDKGTVDELELTDCGQFLGASASYQSLIIDHVAFASTSSCSDLQATDCNLIDSGSTIDASNCIVYGNSSEVTADNCTCVQFAGSLEASGSTAAFVTGTDASNEDGLTSGTGFNPNLNAGAVLYDGDLTLQATVGNVIVKSLTGDAQIEATIGNIINDASLNITSTAGATVDTVAGADITMLSTGLISAEAGGDINITTEGAAVVQGQGVVITASEEVAMAGANITLFGIINEN